MGPLPAVLLLCSHLLIPSPKARGDLRPCRPDDPARLRASADLYSLDAAINRLDPDASVAELVQRLDNLMASKCFQMLPRNDCARNHWSSAAALKRYWYAGGSGHLRSFLDLGKPEQSWLRLPPELPWSLETDTFQAGNPLHDQICSGGDDGCGLETAAWSARLRRIVEREAPPRCPGEQPPATAAACTAFAVKGHPRLRFQRFIDCLSTLQRTPRVLPVGQLRVQREGWLAIWGRRGRTRFCDELRAFDLATGAQVSVSRCGSRTLGRHGFVAADLVGDERIELGHVSVEAIRETAWTLLMQHGVRASLQLRGVFAELPASIPRSLPRDRAALADPDPLIHRTCLSVNSEDSTLSWSAYVRGQYAATGSLPRRRDPNDAHNDGLGDHAASLLRRADTSFIRGCPRSTPPPGLFREMPLFPGWQRAVAAIAACRDESSTGSP